MQFVKQGEIDPIGSTGPITSSPTGDLAEEALHVMRDALA